MSSNRDGIVRGNGIRRQMAEGFDTPTILVVDLPQDLQEFIVFTGLLQNRLQCRGRSGKRLQTAVDYSYSLL